MTSADALAPTLLGFSTGLALIVAIGAQNAFVLRVGIASRARVIAPVVVVCALSDAVLILAGILGVGKLIDGAPVALLLVRILGAGFLLAYGVLAAVRVFRPQGALVPEGQGAVAVRSAVLTVIALTWLNPHVYLDTLVLLGSIGNQQGEDDRWWWAGGAILASITWFTALGFGARLLRRFFARPSSWRILDALIAVVMIALGIRIALGH